MVDQIDLLALGLAPSKIRINADGTVKEEEARMIESLLRSRLLIKAKVDRVHNVLSDHSVRLIPG